MTIDAIPIQLATLIRCESTFGGTGYVIRWRARTRLIWQLALARVKSLPADRREFIASEGAWWIDSEVIARLRGVFQNFDTALAAAQIDGGKRLNRMPAEVADAFRILHLAPDAPAEIVRAVIPAMTQYCVGDHHAVLRVHLSGEKALQWAQKKKPDVA